MKPRTPDYKADAKAMDLDNEMWRHVILQTDSGSADKPAVLSSSVPEYEERNPSETSLRSIKVQGVSL